MGLVEDTSMGRLILRMLSSIAEFDRDMIVERLAEGKAIAKQNPDFKEGRPKLYNKKQIAHALQLLETHSYKQAEEKTGISKSTLTHAKREIDKEGRNNEKIEIQQPEDVMKRLEAIAAVDGKDVAEVTEKIVSLYVGRYENLVNGSINAVNNIKNLEYSVKLNTFKKRGVLISQRFLFGVTHYIKFGNK